MFNDRVFRGGDQTTFNFAKPTTGFGGIFDLAPGGFGQALKFTVGGVTLVSPELGGVSGAFFGFISTTAFTSVLINAGSDSGAAETCNLDNLRFYAVPEASTWAMMIAGFGLVGAALRRRATAVASYANL